LTASLPTDIFNNNNDGKNNNNINKYNNSIILAIKFNKKNYFYSLN